MKQCGNLYKVCIKHRKEKGVDRYGLYYICLMTLRLIYIILLFWRLNLAFYILSGYLDLLSESSSLAKRL